MGNNYKFDIIKIPLPIIIYSDYSYDVLRAMFQSTDVMISTEIEKMSKNEEKKVTFQLLFDDSDLLCIKILIVVMLLHLLYSSFLFLLLLV